MSHGCFVEEKLLLGKLGADRGWRRGGRGEWVSGGGRQFKVNLEFACQKDAGQIKKKFGSGSTLKVAALTPQHCKKRHYNVQAGK